ncbi:hypothetical protein PC123_g16429 [Phytophthora cactorum]|nr:hypothetical protein PC120_g6341 [Phytophthora cactorum]KAG4048262.1 hypothetical protein PC123_g16429 [Phytophthora cactorum]
MLTPNEYAYGDCCKLIPSSYHLGHSGITRSMIRLRRKKKRLSAEAFLHADPCCCSRHAQQDRREFQSPTLAKLGGRSSAISHVCMLQTTVAEYEMVHQVRHYFVQMSCLRRVFSDHFCFQLCGECVKGAAVEGRV